MDTTKINPPSRRVSLTPLAEHLLELRRLCRTSLLFGFLVSGIILATSLAATPLNAALIVDHSVSVEHQNHLINFEIVFDTVPDFFTVDTGGRQADAFQYYVDDDSAMFPGPSSQQDLAETIIRGGEIHVDGDIRIRDRHGDGGPDSGGWGPLRGASPYVLVGTTLTFQTTFDVLNTPDGAFNYHLLMVNFGKSAQPVLFGDTIPIPTTLPLLLSGLVGLGLIGRRRRKTD